VIVSYVPFVSFNLVFRGFSGTPEPLTTAENLPPPAWQVEISEFLVNRGGRLNFRRRILATNHLWDCRASGGVRGFGMKCDHGREPPGPLIRSPMCGMGNPRKASFDARPTIERAFERTVYPPLVFAQADSDRLRGWIQTRHHRHGPVARVARMPPRERDPSRPIPM